MPCWSHWRFGPSSVPDPASCKPAITTAQGVYQGHLLPQTMCSQFQSIYTLHLVPESSGHHGISCCCPRYPDSDHLCPRSVARWTLERERSTNGVYSKGFPPSPIYVFLRNLSIYQVMAINDHLPVLDRNGSAIPPYNTTYYFSQLIDHEDVRLTWNYYGSMLIFSKA